MLLILITLNKYVVLIKHFYWFENLILDFGNTKWFNSIPHISNRNLKDINISRLKVYLIVQNKK
jgi:hypothetical protein